MPKFVAVTDPEKALSEQHGDPSMAKHREWESKQYVTINREAAAGGQECIAMAKKTTGKQKMVLKNGLWVKVQVDEAPQVGGSGGSKGSVLGSRNEFGEKVGAAASGRRDDTGNGERSRSSDDR